MRKIYFGVILLFLLICCSLIIVNISSGESGLSINSNVESDKISTVQNIDNLVIPLYFTIETYNLENIDQKIQTQVTVTTNNTELEYTDNYTYKIDKDITENRYEVAINTSVFNASAFPDGEETAVEISIDMDNQDLTTDSSTSKVVVDKTNKYNSCESILNNNPNANTGIYSIVNNGNRYDVYCDMEYDGGGWTLVMKSNGNQSEFKYNSELWTDTSVTLNTESLNFDTSIPAKYESYNSVHGTEIRAEFPDKGHQMTESFRSSKTPYDIFTTTNELGFENDGYGIPPCSTSAGIGRYGDYWTNANGESNLNNSETIFAHQCGYQKYGFNISTSDSGYTANNVRWGWQWNNENDSFQSQDTTSGIGMDEYTYDGYTYKTTTGSQVYCCSNKDSLRDENDGEHPRDILIWIR